MEKFAGGGFGCYSRDVDLNSKSKTPWLSFSWTMWQWNAATVNLIVQIGSAYSRTDLKPLHLPIGRGP